MKYALAGFMLILFPTFALAHGGVSKNVGNNVVNLNQNPLSPLVGENVVMSFAIRNLKNEPLKNLKIKLTLTDTFYDDESKDKVILTKDFTTDDNGDFEFNYTFDKENYFDIDLDFTDPETHEALNTGFLVQPRAVSGVKNNWVYGLILIGGAAVGYWIKSQLKVS